MGLGFLGTVIVILSILIVSYLFLIFLLTFYFAKVPRTIYDAYPDFGIVEDLRIPVGKKEIELWVVRNNTPTENTVILVHAWGRDRGRMVCRAEKWSKLGFNTIIISARDHGKSDKMFTGQHILRFAEDIEAVVDWWAKPVVLHGHSIGGGSSILVASRNPLVKGVVAEAAPRVILSGLKEFYKPFPDWLTSVFYLGIKLIFRLLMIWHEADEYNPIMAAEKIKVPMLLLYARDDEIFHDIDRIEKAWSALENTKVVLFNKGGHSTMSKQESYDNVLANFITEKL